jgi:hypothetical protein
MKYCPQCKKQYTENWITFCSDDGTILIDTGYEPQAGGQRPPYAPPMSEQPTWRSPDPNAPGAWVPERIPSPSPSWQPPPPPSVYPGRQQQNGLATASMILGVIGLFTGLFCFGPIPGIAALILGVIALNQINRSPQTSTGKPLAMVGMITGGLSILVYGAIFIAWIISAIVSH